MPTTEEHVPTESKRELGKTARRRQIVNAASDLVRRHGFDAVSMIQIAAKAKVSPATPYNLFQSKAAIFQEVFNLDLEMFEARLAEAPARDGIERIFTAITIATALYAKEPKFYRAMGRGSWQSPDASALGVSEPRRALYQRLVAEAIDDGGLSKKTDASLLGSILTQFFRGVFLDWVAEIIPAQRLADEAAYGFAVLLLGHASERAAPALAKRLRKLEAALSLSAAQGSGQPRPR